MQRLDRTPVDQIGPVPVNNGTEGETVPPGLGEVLNADARVFVRGFLGPSQQVVLRGNVRFLAYDDVRYLKLKCGNQLKVFFSVIGKSF